MYSSLVRAVSWVAFLGILWLGPTKKMQLVFDQHSDGKEIQLQKGESFRITLAETPTSGYQWHFLSDGAPVCTLVGDSFRAGSQQAGGAGVHEWHFEAKSPGRATLKMELARGWDRTATTRSFALSVIVP